MTPIYISQGEHAVGAEPDVVIATVLGSCISICLWDPVSGVGGMNHLVLPGLQREGNEMSVGATDMDILINKMMPLGAVRSRLRAKLFGGASMLNGRTEIGARNAEFGRAYLGREGIPCDADNTGGTRARRVRFWPATGKAQMRFVKEAPDPVFLRSRERNDVELF